MQLHSKFRQFPTVCKLLARGLCRSVSSALLSLRKSSRSNVNWLHRGTRFMKWQSLLFELRGNCHKLHRRHKKSNYIHAAVQLPGSGPTPANLGHTGRSNCNNTTTSATTTPNNFRGLQNTSKKTKKRESCCLEPRLKPRFSSYHAHNRYHRVINNFHHPFFCASSCEYPALYVEFLQIAEMIRNEAE